MGAPVTPAACEPSEVTVAPTSMILPAPGAATVPIAEHAASAVPQIWLALPDDITVKLGYSFGSDRGRETFARLALEVGL